MPSPTRRQSVFGASALLLTAAQAQAAAPLRATPAQTEGPYYPDRMPADTDPDLVRIAGKLRDAGGEFRLGTESSGSSPRAGVTVRSTDGEGQESARALTFGAAGGHALIVAKPVDLVRQANGEMALAFRYRIDAKPQGAVRLTLGQAQVDVTSIFNGAPLGQWRTLKVPLSCLRVAGADLTAVDQPWGLRAADALGVTVEDIRLGSDEGDTICPAA